MLPEPPAATVLYASLDLPEEEASQFDAAMRELPDWLRREPIGAPVSVAPMPTAWLDAVSDILAQAPDIPEAVADLTGLVMEEGRRIPCMVLGCTPDHEFARKARHQFPDGLWGVACDRFTLCYFCENPYSVWHETLHTLGAEDCYDLETKRTTCECAGCLMQYAAAEDTIGDWPWLCRANQERIRSYAKKCAAANKKGEAPGG